MKRLDVILHWGKYRDAALPAYMKQIWKRNALLAIAYEEYQDTFTCFDRIPELGSEQTVLHVNNQRMIARLT